MQGFKPLERTLFPQAFLHRTGDSPAVSPCCMTGLLTTDLVDAEVSRTVVVAFTLHVSSTNLRHFMRTRKLTPEVPKGRGRQRRS